MKCLACGTEYPSGSRFCRSSGIRLSAVCQSCGGLLLESARFCTQCGAMVAVGQRIGLSDQPLVAGDSPFQTIRARSLLLWAVLGIPVLILVYVFASIPQGSDEDIDPLFDVLIFDAWLYGLLVAWVIWKSRRHHVDFGSLIGRIPTGYRWPSVLGVVALLIVFSLSTFWLFLYLLARSVPEAAEVIASGELFATSEFTQYPVLYNTEIVVVAVVLAPVIEELIFRGMLLTRWSAKWGPTKSILLSSFIFAILHADLVGAFVFGVVMSLLYINTRTLLVPMAAHFLNNLLAVTLSAVELVTDTGESAPLIEDLESGLTVAIVSAAIALPVLLWYIIQRWPRGDRTAPYLSRAV